MKAMQDMAAQNSQMQAQQAAQAAQQASQSRAQEMQMEAQLEAQKMQLKNQLEAQLESVKHEYRREIELIRAQATLGFKTDDQEFKEKIEVLKEDRKDKRVDQQAVKQSKLIAQRQGERGELDETEAGSDSGDIIDQLINI